MLIKSGGTWEVFQATELAGSAIGWVTGLPMCMPRKHTLRVAVVEMFKEQ